MDEQNLPLEASSNIDSLVAQLSSKDMLQRMRAGEALTALGAAAIPAVTELADARDDHVRWECAKTLSQIADASSVDTLVRLLEDSGDGTRWDAALGLIAIGQPAVAPLLRAIIHRSPEYTIIGGARHVLHEWSGTKWGALLRPVYEALNSSLARESAPVEAGKALKAWDEDNPPK